MKKTIATVLVLLVGIATMAEGGQAWKFAFQPFKGQYSIYGGGLGDPVAPTDHSKNIAFSISGQAAKQMFDAMGPDLKGVCGAEDGNRIRQRAEVVCSYASNLGYECNFGFDLISGRSIGGSLC